MDKTAVYSLAIHSKLLGHDITDLAELCEPHVVQKLREGWSIVGKRSAHPPSGCRECAKSNQRSER